MAAHPIEFHAAPDDSVSTQSAPTARARMSTRSRLLFFLAAWLVVLMPFLFWWSTWFGRPLSGQQMSEYLNDERHPRHIQHALVQLGQRMNGHDPSAARRYGDLVRLASHPREEVRSTDAWVMGQDPTNPDFHQTLLTMLNDPSLLVRGNAALSLVSFGDSAGRQQIVALLKPVAIVAPSSGQVRDTTSPGTAIHQGGLVAKLQDGSNLRELRSPISGRVQTIVASVGTAVSAGSGVATVAPGDDQIWEALRALYIIGQPDDLLAIRPYERELPEVSDRVRQQAKATEQAITNRVTRGIVDN